MINTLWPHAAAQPWFLPRGTDRHPRAAALAGTLIAVAILWSLVEEGYGLPFRQASTGALAGALRRSAALIFAGAGTSLSGAAVLVLGWARLRGARPRPGLLLVTGLLCCGAGFLIANG